MYPNVTGARQKTEKVEDCELNLRRLAATRIESRKVSVFQTLLKVTGID